MVEATAVGGAMGVSGVGILYGLTNPMVAALVVLCLRFHNILLHKYTLSHAFMSEISNLNVCNRSCINRVLETFCCTRGCTRTQNVKLN